MQNNTINRFTIQPIKPFMTIRETAKATGLSSYTLREMHKREQLPGLTCGSRFMVDVEALLTNIRNNN